MRKILMLLMVSLILGMNETQAQIGTLKSANEAGYDTTRLYAAMAKARRGEDINLVFLGGSITNGYAASTEAKRYTNLVQSWWKTKFPNTKINLINAGIGGTGTDIGTFRVQEDVLKYNPDFVIIEFSVNDAEGEQATVMMEGLVRQLLKHPSHPGVMMLMLKQSNGTTAQQSHKPVGNYYKVPMISFADLIDAQVAKDGVTLSSIFTDGLHPLDAGMKYIAQFITDELDVVYNNLPADELISPIDASLPLPLKTNVYETTYSYNTKSLATLTNKGWKMSKSLTWEASNVGDEMSFKVDGNAVAIIYAKHNAATWGQIEIWVDNGVHKNIDAFWTQTWGPAKVFSVIEENLADGEHILHIKISDQTTSTNSGHYFNLLNVLKAGNIRNAAPIAVTQEYCKSLIGTEVPLNADQSYSLNDSLITSYNWSIVSAPVNSLASIINAGASAATFTPDIEGNYQIGLTVANAMDTSVVRMKLINVKKTNALPVANAGNDQFVLPNKNVLLDGSLSSDPDGDIISYKWRIIQQPEGSVIKMAYDNIAIGKFAPRIEGTYLIGLVINDSIEFSKEDTAIINVSANNTSVNSVNNTLGINVFPNPVNQKITVRSENLQKGDLLLALINIDGKEIYSSNLQIADASFSTSIDVSSYSKGIYILKSIQGNACNLSKIIIE